MRVTVDVMEENDEFRRFRLTVPDYFSRNCGISFTMSRAEATDLADALNLALADMDGDDC